MTPQLHLVAPSDRKCTLAVRPESTALMRGRVANRSRSRMNNPFEILRNRPDRRVLKHQSEGEFTPQQFLDPLMDLNHQDRVSTNVEKIVIRRNLFADKYFSPDRSDAAFQIGPRDCRTSFY